jgi:short-subunit dehydrogenase
VLSRQRDLRGMRALVTGGSSGVGRALAMELARCGCDVLATARRADRLATLAADRPGGRIITLQGDITDPATRSRLISLAVDAFAGLDLLVAAAGSGAVGDFRTASPETLSRIMAIDFEAPAELVREALPMLASGRDPAIVFIGSILGIHPLPLHAEYSAAKAAVRSLAGSLRHELRADGIEVLLASLGPTESEFWEHLVTGERPDWSRGRPLPAIATARAIISGLRRRRREVLPGWRARGYALAARWLPGLLDTVISRRLGS